MFLVFSLWAFFNPFKQSGAASVMFLCGDSFDFLMAWKVSLFFFMEVKRKERMASGDADSIWDGRGRREKSRERVCSLRFREDEQKKNKKSVFAFVRSLIRCTQFVL